MTDAVIRTRGLTKRYGDRTVVDALDLEVHAGEVFGLLGPNGAGKTTTILMLLGLTEPTSGEVEVVGFDPRRSPLEVKRRVGYLPDSVGFYDTLTGRQNLRYTARLNGLDDGEHRIDELLAMVGLADAADMRTGTYSRGMLQRLGVADALVKDPAVLVLDEPTIAIDPEGVAQVLALIRRLAEERGVALLLSSHLLHQVQSVCDRVGIFVSGRMVACGRMEELASSLATGRVTIEVAASDGTDLFGILSRIDGVVTVTSDAHDPVLWIVEAERDVRSHIVRALAVDGIEPVHLRRRVVELDEIYRRYFAEPMRDELAG